MLLALAGCNLNDPSPADVRRAEVEDLGGDGENAPKLAAILADAKEDDLARAVAAAELGEMSEGRRHADVLVAAVDDASALVRHDSIVACGRLSIEAASAAVAARLGSDPDVNVRRAAAAALGAVRGDGAVAALLAAFDDRDLGVQENAAASLRSLTGQKIGRDAEAWRAWASGRQGP
ncbi:MAG: HEAT repeat domain-containing protein [Planctomycetia bacterium]|nr:HEAT repeat domain-containing protein [Planctomycetia bacterium]